MNADLKWNVGNVIMNNLTMLITLLIGWSNLIRKKTKSYLVGWSTKASLSPKRITSSSRS